MEDIEFYFEDEEGQEILSVYDVEFTVEEVAFVTDTAIAPDGTLAVVGRTMSPEYPTTVGAYDTSDAGGFGMASSPCSRRTELA